MYQSKLSNFKGLIAPVFTPFNEDCSVNYGVIEEYAKLLKSKGINAVLVNGTTGEGMSMSTDERKKSALKWSQVCSNLGMALMLQISGCSFADVVDLVTHATMLKVDGVLCLPELYFKPKTAENLVGYLKEIAVHCPEIPLYYYHIPKLTNVEIPMANFMKLAGKEIKTFKGIKFSASDLDQAVSCLEHGQVFLGSVTIFCGALALGFDSAIMTLLNIKPEACIEIQRFMDSGKVKEARKTQNELNDFVEETLKNGEDVERVCQF
jgi:N-acetylneuraminate lyase